MEKIRTKYSWKTGSRITLKAEVLGPCLRALAQRHGKAVAAKKLVEEARDPEHVAHDAFEWNNTKAAERYRIFQANHLLRSICFNVITPKGSGEVTRLFAAIRDSEEPNKSTYVLSDYAMSNKELREQVLQRALSELSSFKLKYQRLSELADVFKAIDRVLDKNR